MGISIAEMTSGCQQGYDYGLRKIIDNYRDINPSFLPRCEREDLCLTELCVYLFLSLILDIYVDALSITSFRNGSRQMMDG